MILALVEVDDEMPGAQRAKVERRVNTRCGVGMSRQPNHGDQQKEANSPHSPEPGPHL